MQNYKTVQVSEEVWRLAKQRALDESVSLREVVESAVRMRCAGLRVPEGSLQRPTTMGAPRPAPKEKHWDDMVDPA